MRCRPTWACESLANGAGVSRSWIGIFSTGQVLCAHKKCVESSSNPDNRIVDGCENESNKPRTEFPFVSVCSRASAFLSIARAQGWRKYGAVGLCGYNNSRQCSDLCLVKIEHASTGQGKRVARITGNSKNNPLLMKTGVGVEKVPQQNAF